MNVNWLLKYIKTDFLENGLILILIFHPWGTSLRPE